MTWSRKYTKYVVQAHMVSPDMSISDPWRDCPNSKKGSFETLYEAMAYRDSFEEKFGNRKGLDETENKVLDVLSALYNLLDGKLELRIIRRDVNEELVEDSVAFQIGGDKST